MTEKEDLSIKTYRYKFSKTFLPNLLEFARIHRYDDVELFKKNWNDWIKNNKDIILRENLYLESLGYKGEISQKMYKSVRYYYKNKSLVKQKPRKRRQYIDLDRDFLDIIDIHLDSIDNNTKPSVAFKNFHEKPNNKKAITNEIKRLKKYNLDINDINLKIKKTYKNRHYIKFKK
tara:strand:- start:243 stop:767 length:525 start_codon:yes stop_codon:yes gene_type:complete